MLWYMSWTQFFSFSISVMRGVSSLVGFDECCEWLVVFLNGWFGNSGDGRVGDIGVRGSKVAGAGVGFGVSGLISWEIANRAVICSDLGGGDGHRSLEIGIEQTAPGGLTAGLDGFGGGSCEIVAEATAMEVVTGRGIGLGVSGVISREIASREVGFGDPGGEIGEGRLDTGAGGIVGGDAGPGRTATAVVPGGVVERVNTGDSSCEIGVEGVIGRDVVPWAATRVTSADGCLNATMSLWGWFGPASWTEESAWSDLERGADDGVAYSAASRLNLVCLALAVPVLVVLTF